MQDIRKPYTRSRSSNDLQSRVEQFEAARYRRENGDVDEPVQIPVKKVRRDVRDMDMYPRRKDDDLYYDDNQYIDEENERPARGAGSRKSTRKITLGNALFIIAFFAVVTGLMLYTYVFDSATITVVPKYKDVTDVSKVVTFSKDGTDIDAVPYTVAKTSLSKSKTLTQSETRKVESKASGKIVVYNNFDNKPQKLIKNTRFESSTGKIYRINQSIEIPGKKGDTPGSVEVIVYADNNGSDYNVESTTFSIPGFKGTPREKAFYAKTNGPVTGGSLGIVSLASLSDINAAKDALAVELKKDIQSEVAKIKKEGSVPMYTATEIVYEDNEQELLKGVTAVYKVTATANLILADEGKLASALAKTFADYDNAPVRLAYQDALTYTRKESDHVDATTTLSILVEGKPRVIWKSDFSAIKELVKGKKRDDFKPIMKTINSIESAEISFSPFWLSHFPDQDKKLTVEESLPKR
jgi:hypothetical protein